MEKVNLEAKEVKKIDLKSSTLDRKLI